MRHLWMLHDVVVVWHGPCNNVSSARLYKELAWESLNSRRKLHLLSQFYKIVKNLAHYFSKLLPKLSSERTNYRLRSRENLKQSFHVEILGGIGHVCGIGHV